MKTALCIISLYLPPHQPPNRPGVPADPTLVCRRGLQRRRRSRFNSVVSGARIGLLYCTVRGFQLSPETGLDRNADRSRQRRSQHLVMNSRWRGARQTRSAAYEFKSSPTLSLLYFALSTIHVLFCSLTFWLTNLPSSHPFVSRPRYLSPSPNPTAPPTTLHLQSFHCPYFLVLALTAHASSENKLVGQCLSRLQKVHKVLGLHLGSSIVSPHAC